MVDLDWKAKMVVTPDLPNKSPRISTNKLHVSIPGTAPFKPVTNISPVLASDPACSAYDQYLRLPELKKLWSTQDFPTWRNEAVLKPAFHALEITFRFVSTVLTDPRPHANRREWKRRLESLASSQIEIISQLVEDEEADPETRGTAPILDLSSSNGVIERDGSYTEVWKVAGGESTIVNRTSEGSLLPRLATWQKSEDMAQKILFSIECEMRRCPYTLGLGEPNLSGKPNIQYDAICRPNEVHSLKKCPWDEHVHNHNHNHENQNVYTTHQILECWIQVGKQLLSRAIKRIEDKKYEEASSDCYLLSNIWDLLSDVEDLLLITDPDDFLKLKAQLLTERLETAPLCFRSKSLVELTKSCKEELRNKVPEILGVEVDPTGGPRVQEAAMRLYKGSMREEEKEKEKEKIELLQGMQRVEKALKGFYYSYKQVMMVVMGSLEAKGNGVVMVSERAGWSGDSLAHLFLEPTYFPTLDAAKTFLGEEYWSHQWGSRGGSRVEGRPQRRNNH